jgi:hypothetical protein
MDPPSDDRRKRSSSCLSSRYRARPPDLRAHFLGQLRFREAKADAGARSMTRCAHGECRVAGTRAFTPSSLSRHWPHPPLGTRRPGSPHDDHQPRGGRTGPPHLSGSIRRPRGQPVRAHPSRAREPADETTQLAAPHSYRPPTADRRERSSWTPEKTRSRADTPLAPSARQFVVTSNRRSIRTMVTWAGRAPRSTGHDSVRASVSGARRLSGPRAWRSPRPPPQPLMTAPNGEPPPPTAPGAAVRSRHGTVGRSRSGVRPPVGTARGSRPEQRHPAALQSGSWSDTSR